MLNHGDWRRHTTGRAVLYRRHGRAEVLYLNYTHVARDSRRRDTTILERPI
jgi:hypothetical protein